MHAALAINIPNYARAIVTTNAVVDALAAVHTRGSSAPSLYERSEGMRLSTAPRSSQACW